MTNPMLESLLGKDKAEQLMKEAKDRANRIDGLPLLIERIRSATSVIQSMAALRTSETKILPDSVLMEKAAIAFLTKQFEEGANLPTTVSVEPPHIDLTAEPLEEISSDKPNRPRACYRG